MDISQTKRKNVAASHTNNHVLFIEFIYVAFCAKPFFGGSKNDHLINPMQIEVRWV